MNWYWANRVLDEFYDAESRLPGVSSETIEADVEKCVEIQKKLFSDIKLEQEVEKAVLAEIARYGGAEMHNTAALIGGVASQVSMKLILRQFFPLNHTMIHNGIYCETAIFSV